METNDTTWQFGGDERSLKADMAVSALLPQSLPTDLYVQKSTNLPKLPEFLIHLRRPDRNLSSQEQALIVCIENALGSFD